ncbi:ubiquitin C-terminal hydrolase Ubp8, putative [Talaromyces stipitatus ATCC 10500]|uniref:ubiquitinyl hydrolase 1 n=1 Tax=Talaromyces stipitatus (strain ATCC 10500 / CBS 375.48 / QM 6759 / NRRL 1006) TaxID=441959 RepID=B8MAN8_TALSN|nr:ubiquitin C-terminal hydrolase Ubp8, putative [Talaromyces stipitatus ATCC 10500]EED17462.1 ubiquitin C-terminal hydrolase Ubp8, putative [Talaromyces stipitatus ATCC 10500]
MAASVTSLATVVQVNALSEAEYGCEHLSGVLKDDDGRGSSFIIAYMKQAAARMSKNIRSRNGIKSQSLPLKPIYICVDCSEKYTNGDRQVHSDQTGHQFYIDSRTGALFCQSCRDFVYDHELEKIRTRAAGLWSRDPLDRDNLDGSRVTTSIESAVLDAYARAKKANGIALAQDTALSKPSRYILDILSQLSNKSRKRKANEISGDESNGNGNYLALNGITTTEIPEADETYVKTNATKRTCQSEGVRGLFNLGQTCYMNVVLQTLLHEPLLNAFFLGNGHKYYDCQIDGCVLCAMSRAFAEFNGCDKKDGFTAETLLYSTWKNHPPLAGNHQQDAHEFYQFLAGGLHTASSDENDQLKCNCFFCKALFGKFQSTLTCPICKHTSPTEQPLLELSLDVQLHSKKRQMNGKLRGSSTPTLAGCLQSWVTPEELIMEGYQCQGCHSYPDKLTKQLRIKQLPAMLCMQMKVPPPQNLHSIQY